MTRIYPQFIVAKFGGTSVADFDAMNRSASIVLADPNVRLVVLSASAGVTNLLVELSEGLESHLQFDKLETLRTIQYNIISRLKNPSIISTEIDNLLENIGRLAHIAMTSPSTALSDELVSHGELMSSLLFTEVLRERGVEASWFDARSVMRTDSNYGCAEPDVTTLAELAELHLRPRIEQAIMITQGFIGRDESGHTTTLGRGGSDYTASLLGEALHAARVDIWTDVAGIYTTDPRIAPKAKRIDSISFSEASDMAAYGAKVLHPATLMPAMRKNIPVFVGSSKDTAAGGTLVCCTTENPPSYRAVAVRRKQTLVRLHSLNAQPSYRFLAQIFALLEQHTVAADLVTTSENSIALALDSTNATSGEDPTLTTALFTALSSHCRVEVETGLALITLIGNQLTQASSVCKDVFARFDEHAVRMICHGASSNNLCFLLPGDVADSAVKALHQRLFE
ncbi:MAG: lysine-sensitive aspartokinase 3 [Kluyvera cryocrescens]|uniref:Aspartokinase n=1 Tax=Kluyvera cryocrescens TaxID=580 RepID=A0A485BK42_KLUCR|nr:lysine-sensitive aspartokinase 3 [Kluyvera cryocrescens]MCX2866657.1 lysine-sensitive aspartokinase 3 [Kluyvera cryocrescens]MDU5687319.1 lysine-sensitive aspartokinase 3 [Kluyvera cryocrescens]MDW3776522.1 lysine-sensitive aspartokinase 3 [Kluyvera cryocrescens]MEB7557836.1 lysine-sensitive aspartokinase 3 [Kluyvera cryocrescens]MEB7712752.1 lysine-sensitive aspartokinase 3 [Kluyvera cryocrescens]